MRLRSNRFAFVCAELHGTTAETILTTMKVINCDGHALGLPSTHRWQQYGMESCRPFCTFSYSLFSAKRIILVPSVDKLLPLNTVCKWRNYVKDIFWIESKLVCVLIFFFFCILSSRNRRKAIQFSINFEWTFFAIKVIDKHCEHYLGSSHRLFHFARNWTKNSNFGVLDTILMNEHQQNIWEVSECVCV